MTILIGTSGFSYEHWENGVFYPPGLAKMKELEHYCRFFDSVELNVTFYRLPSKATFDSWKKRTPEDFRFALKGSRLITHIKRLKNVEEPLRVFFDQAKPIIPKTAVVLWQLPPGLKLNLPLLEDFVKLLRKHKSVLHAFEFREESWFTKDVFDLTASAGMTICRADWPEFSDLLPASQPFEYVRRHGPAADYLYAGCYSERQLKTDAEGIKKWRKAGKDVFVYFNNDADGYAVQNALRLKEMIWYKAKSVQP